MRWKLRRRSIRKRHTVDLAVDACVAWREECRAVRNAYLARRRARAARSCAALDSRRRRSGPSRQPPTLRFDVPTAGTLY